MLHILELGRETQFEQFSEERKRPVRSRADHPPKVDFSKGFSSMIPEELRSELPCLLAEHGTDWQTWVVKTLELDTADLDKTRANMTLMDVQMRHGRPCVILAWDVDKPRQGRSPKVTTYQVAVGFLDIVPATVETLCAFLRNMKEKRALTDATEAAWRDAGLSADQVKVRHDQPIVDFHKKIDDERLAVAHKVRETFNKKP